MVKKQAHPLVHAGSNGVRQIIPDMREDQGDNSFGDMSSIMITPDQMYNNFNLLEDEED